MKKTEYAPGKAYGTKGCVLALGFFDGVHEGHRALLRRTVAEAKRKGTPSAVFTFSYDGGIKSGAPRIYSEETRDMLFAELGIDVCIAADFSKVSSISAEDFVLRVIREEIGAEVVVAGYNYRFGYRGGGDARKLEELARSFGCEAVILDAYMLDAEPVSSTLVRALLANGDVFDAGRLLGKPYFLSGTVEHGRADGRKIGFPTINVPVSQKQARLKHGVYLTAVKIDEKLYTGLTNVGECPTFEKREYHAETFVLDFERDVYGMETKLYFLDFIREERAFSSAAELAEQIRVDEKMARERMKEIKWQELGLN